MKIRMRVKVINTGQEFNEEYDIKHNINPRSYAQNLIKEFNDTLRPHESPRKLLDVIVVDKESKAKHNHMWVKINLVTISRGGMNYDKVKCSRCGITGKRYGLGCGVQRDNKYKAKIYNTCEGAIEQMNKLEVRRREKQIVNLGE